MHGKCGDFLLYLESIIAVKIRIETFLRHENLYVHSEAAIERILK